MITGLVLALALPAVAQDPTPASLANAAERQAAAQAHLAGRALEASATPRELPNLDVSKVLEEGVGLHPLGDKLVGAGPGYVASFDEDGFRLRSHAGAGLANEFGFRLESVERGLDDRFTPDSAAFEQHGNLAIANHGAFEERYEVRREGIEQSFLLRELPSGSGDLVLRGAVETGLTAPLGIHSDGIELAREGTTRIRVGEVWAFDAAGRSVEGTLRWSAESLELVVPGSFVDAARLPLLVDPLIEVEWDVWPGAREIDVAYDENNDRYIAVWWIPSLATLQAQRFDGSGGEVGPVIQVSDPDHHVGPASVANINASEVFPVAYQAFEPAEGIHLRTIDAATGAVSDYVKTATPTDDDLLPQVGGDPIPPYDDAVVVWGSGGVIRYQLAECPAGVTPGFLGSPTPADATLSPANWRVTNSNGPAGTWMATWDHGTPSRSLRGLLMRFDGTSCSLGSIALSLSGSAHHAAPAGDGTNFAVVYEYDDEDLGHNLYAVCGQLDGQLGCDFQESGPPVPLPEDTSAFAYGPDVEIVEGNYLAGWLRDDGKVESVRLSPTTCGTCGPHAIVSQLGTLGSGSESLRMTSAYSASFATADDAVLFAWENDPESHAALVEAMQDGAVIDLGGGCPGGPLLSYLGEPNIGTDFELVGTVPNSVFAGSILAAPEETIFGLGDCDVLLPSATFSLTVDPPEFTLPIPLPCKAQFAGTTWRLQLVLIGDPAVIGAPSGYDGVTLSNVIELTFGG